MADNITVTPGVGATIAGDEVGGVLFQRVKLSLGDDGIFGGDVSSSNPIPVTTLSSVLPAGAATETLQIDGNASLVSLLAELELKADLTEIQPVSVATLPLPSDASTSALQVDGNALISSISTKIDDQSTAAKQDLLLAELQLKADLTETQPVSLASQPLPTGASTSALQATGNASLASIDSKMDAKATASKQDLLLAELQLKADLTETQPVSMAALPLPSGAATAALQTTGNATLASIDAGIPSALGSAIISASMPVNIASDQVIPISASALPLPTGAATAALQTSGNASLTSIDSKLTSQSTAAKQDLLLAELQLKADLTETQPVSLASQPLPTGASTSALQTAGNSLLSSIDAKTPAFGQATMAASCPVVIASNQTPLLVNSGDSLKTTYSASVHNFTAATLATDIFTITGSATKIVSIRYIYVSMKQTTAAMQAIEILRRSTANTGGTSTTQTNMKYDQNDAAATATVLSYTANPTLGTLVGRLASKQLYSSGLIPANNGQFAPGNYVEFAYKDATIKPLMLRGTSDIIAINFGAVTAAGNSFDIFVEWTEE